MSDHKSDSESDNQNNCVACGLDPIWACQADQCDGDCYNDGCKDCTEKGWYADHTGFYLLCDFCTIESQFMHMRAATDEKNAKEIHARMRAAFDIQKLLRRQATAPPRLCSAETQIEHAMDENGKLRTENMLAKHFHTVQECKLVRVPVARGFVPIEITTTFRVVNPNHEIERLAQRRQRRKALEASRRRGGVFRRTRSRARRQQQFLENP